MADRGLESGQQSTTDIVTSTIELYTDKFQGIGNKRIHPKPMIHIASEQNVWTAGRLGAYAYACELLSVRQTSTVYEFTAISVHLDTHIYRYM